MHLETARKRVSDGPRMKSWPMKYSLRKPTEADREPMMRIAHEGLRPHIEPVSGWDQATHEAQFQEHFGSDWISIILVGGEAVGYLKCEEQEDAFFLEGIYLCSEIRGKGLGSAVIHDLIQAAREKGKPLRLRVWQTNPARHLYLRLGFRVTKNSGDRLEMEID